MQLFVVKYRRRPGDPERRICHLSRDESEAKVNRYVSLDYHYVVRLPQ